MSKKNSAAKSVKTLSAPKTSAKKNASKSEAPPVEAPKTEAPVNEMLTRAESLAIVNKGAKSQNVEAPKTEAPVTSGAPIVKEKHANGAAFTTQRPGVLAHIENLLRNATAEAPVTKSEILASLVVAFPDRDEAKMKTTVSMQVPSGFRIEKGYIISSTSKGAYYFDVEKTVEYQKTHEKRGGAWRPKLTVEQTSEQKK